MHFFGSGVEKDYFVAVNWYQLAAEQDEPAAQFALGACYFYGTGVEEDLAMAKDWLQKAADQGNMDAEKLLGKIE